MLGLAPGASREEVQAAWRRLARANHHDRFAAAAPAARAAAERRMRDVNEAYEAIRRNGFRPPVAPARSQPPSPPHPPPAPARPAGLLPDAIRIPRWVFAGLAGLVLALVAVGVLAARTPTGPAPPRSASVVARGLRFAPAVVEVAAERAVELRLVNQDVGYRHNLTVEDRNIVRFRGEPVTGPTAVRYDVPALAAGTYALRCEIYRGMEAMLVVR